MILSENEIDELLGVHDGTSIAVKAMMRGTARAVEAAVIAKMNSSTPITNEKVEKPKSFDEWWDEGGGEVVCRTAIAYGWRGAAEQGYLAGIEQVRNDRTKRGGDAQPVAWAAVHFGGRRDGKIYTTCETREQIEAYIQDVHRSSDSLTLRARPLAFADAPVVEQKADDNDVVYPGGSAPPIPRWVVDSADRIAKYMDANCPGEWALGRIQSRGWG